MEGETITVKIDLVAGTAEITAPSGQFAEAAREAKELLSLKQWSQVSPPEPTVRPETQAPQSTSTKSEPPAPRRSARSNGGSSARPGRIGSFVVQKFPLTEPQQREIYEFYTSKRPIEQREKVAVAMYVGALVLNKRVFDYNEIYSLMRLGNERDLPKALDVVITSMKRENWVSREDEGFSLKFLASDYVEKSLPASVG
jgi:hypothetical protein